MPSLVTLLTAKAQCRIIHSSEDELIQIYIEAATAMVLDYIGSEADQYLDSSGEVIQDSSGSPEVDARLKIATLYIVGLLYKDRDGELMKDWQRGELPAPVVSYLYTLHRPVLG